MHRQRETQTITSSASPAAAVRVVRAHIRSPLVGLRWTVGLADGDILVGLILGKRIYALPLPSGQPQGRVQYSLKLRGKVARGPGGRSEVTLYIKPSSFPLISRAVMALFVAVGLAAFVMTGAVGALIFAGWGVALGLFGEGVRSYLSDCEAGERALIIRWIEEVRTELAKSALA